MLAGQGQVEFHLRATAATQERAQAEVDQLAGELEDELEDAVFSSQGESLEEIVSYYLQMRNAKLAVAESCTGGMIAERITSVAGSSRSFLGGAVVYSNDLKTLFADVPPLMIEAMARSARSRAGAGGKYSRDLQCRHRRRRHRYCGAGRRHRREAGGTGVCRGHRWAQHEVVQRRFFGDRERVRRWASQQALDMVRRMLM